MGSRYLYYFFCAAICFSLNGCAPKKKTDLEKRAIESKPNIVFILADDMGLAQLGCYGSDYYQTPNLDKLANDGMIFKNAYAAAAICSPTRASIMTGKYPARLHITDYIPGQTRETDALETPKWRKFLPLEEVTFAEVLSENGYKTALFGKWHLSKEKKPPLSLEHNPNNQGFQETFLTYKPMWKASKPWQSPEVDAHNIDTITSRGIKFIKENKSRPFFLMLSHNAIHDPLMSKKKLVEKYEKHELNGMPENHPILGAMVEDLDSSVGRLLQTIKEEKLEKNTVVIFYPDNGGKFKYASQIPFRAGKGWLYEGGIRVPLIVKWPEKIKEGSVSEELVSSIDFYSSFLDMAEVQLPENNTIDGVNFIKACYGDKLDRNELYWHYPHYHYGSGMVPASAIRLGDYKLIEWYEKELLGDSNFVELYNIKEDVNEKNNLTKSKPELCNMLLNKLNAWKKNIKAQIPSKKE